MDNKDSNLKSPQTGGLKLMTVFIAVLALHVVIIGSFTVYHLMSGGSTDADLAGADKMHKTLKADGTVADAALPDANQAGDKSSTTTPPATDTASTAAPSATVAEVTNPSIPASAPTSAPEKSTTPDTTVAAPTAPTTPAVIASTPAPAPAHAPKTPTITPSPLVAPSTPDMVDNTYGAGPAAPSLAPPPEQSLTLAPTPAPTLTPGLSLTAGPVHMPPAANPAIAHEATHEHGQTYTVKITDSYKKIAAAHHISVAQLKEANHIKGSTLHAGQKLVIPSSTSVLAEEPAVAEHPAAAPHSTAVQPILANSLSSTVTPEISHHHLYTVVKGDTLIKIAHKFKTTPSALMEANSISDPARLSIGKKLKIPSSESRSARISAPPVVTPSATITPQVSAPIAEPATQPSQDQTEMDQDKSGDLANFTP